VRVQGERKNQREDEKGKNRTRQSSRRDSLQKKKRSPRGMKFRKEGEMVG